MRLCAAVLNTQSLKEIRKSFGVVSPHGRATPKFPRAHSIHRSKTMTDPTVSVRGGASGNSLKEQNRWQLWVIVAVNSLFLWGVIRANAIGLDGLRSVFSDSEQLVRMGFAIVMATVLNGILSA